MRWNAKVIRAQKKIGHDRLEDIVAMGFDRTAIYTELSYKLGLKGKDRTRAHFGHMQTQKEVERAIAALEEIRMRVAPKQKKKKKVAKVVQVEVGALLNPNRLPLSKKRREKLRRQELQEANNAITPEQKRQAMENLKRLNQMHPILKWLWLQYKKYL